MCQIVIMFLALESSVQWKWIRDPSKAITATIPTVKNRCQKIQTTEVRFHIPSFVSVYGEVSLKEINAHDEADRFFDFARTFKWC